MMPDCEARGCISPMWAHRTYATAVPPILYGLFFPAPRAGMNAPHAGMNAPHAGMNAPRAGMNAPCAGMNAPHAGMNAPVRPDCEARL